MATGDSSGGMYTFSGLSTATEYSVEVAAVNSAGTGVYSDPITAKTFINQTVYVGLYNSGGGGMCHVYIFICDLLSPLKLSQPSISGDITISGGITFTVDSDLNGASPQFTLTCISTGGPATTVTWTRDSVTVIEGNETVLDNLTTSQYTHTLTVIGRLGGLYICTVANNKPSIASALFTMQGSTLCHEWNMWTIIKGSGYTTLSPFSSLLSHWCDCVSEWSGQCTSLLDTTIRRTYCDWLHHLLPAARWRT